MSLATIINSLSRAFNKFFMVLLALVIFVILMANAFNTSALQNKNLGVVLLVLWILFTIISFMYMLNGFLLKMNFRKNVKAFQKKGKPVKGIRGFDDLVSGMNSAVNFSIMITLTSIISLVFYIASVYGDYQSISSSEENLKSLMATLGITFAFVTISVIFLVDYPEDSSFNPGGLISFYEPDIFPMTLDNILGDVFKTYIDPITFMDIDEWYADIVDKLNPAFEADEDSFTRRDRAIEKILLVTYLHISNDKLVSKDIVYKEFNELFGDSTDAFLNGDATGLTFKEIVKIIKRIEQKAPEPFRLVDRLMLSLTDDYKYFTSLDTYFTVSGKTNQGSVKESSGIITFLLNNTPRDDRKIKVTMRSDRATVHPDRQSIVLNLDPMTDSYPKDQPEIIGDEDDILGILSDILQVGDAVWFRLKSLHFGFKLVTIQVEELNGSMTAGESLEVKFTKSLNFYVQAYLPKISGAVGLALPVIKGFIGF